MEATYTIFDAYNIISYRILKVYISKYIYSNIIQLMLKFLQYGINSHCHESHITSCLSVCDMSRRCGTLYLKTPNLKRLYLQSDIVSQVETATASFYSLK